MNKTAIQYTIKFSNIKWETDGVSLKKTGLPKNVVLVAIDEENLSQEGYEEYLAEGGGADILSDEYGYLVNNFYFEILNKKVIKND